MSISMRNGLSAASSVSRFTFDDDAKNCSEGCVEKTNEPKERLAAPVVNDMMGLKKMYSVMFDSNKDDREDKKSVKDSGNVNVDSSFNH
eukprot:4362200-Ditylum_brightwellii.AAC.1